MITRSPVTSGSNGRQPHATVESLRERIRSGKYPVGERLPAERELTLELNVHRRVLRAAMTQLEKEGLLNRKRNCRPVVQAQPSDTLPSGEIRLPSSRLVAFIMFHDESVDRVDFAQQRMFWGMNQALGRAGYHAVFLDLTLAVETDEQKSAFESSHLQYVLDHGFGGVVFYAYSKNKSRNLIRDVARKVPLILIDRTVAGVDCDFVGMQNYEVMYEATKTLIEFGHKRIAYVTTNDSINTVQDRLQGYLAAVEEFLGADAADLVLPTPLPGRAWPLFEAAFSLPANRRPTAVVCVNDYEAARVHSLLNSMGLTVPGDVSLIGCDNVVETLPGGVGLTTIAQPFEEIGQGASRLFLRRIEEPARIPDYVELPGNLIRRGSIAPPKSDE